MKQSNKKFNEAKKLKNDEWKSYIVDIELGLRQTKLSIADVICCCNDYDSDFKNYFANVLARNKGTKWPPVAYATFVEFNPKGKAKVLEVDCDLKVKQKTLKGTGDFASEEVIDLINKANIVITNPPFSKFREFVELLVKLEKSFLIMGPKNACAYRWYFRLWKESKVWYGYTENDNFWFQNQKGEWKKFRNIAWHAKGISTKEKPFLLNGPKYKKENYLLLENYKNCIFVDKIKNIPIDYNDLMAVPPSFGYKLNRRQFDLIDIIEPVVNEKRLYTKIIIKKTKAEFLHEPYHKIDWSKNE